MRTRGEGRARGPRGRARHLKPALLLALGLSPAPAARGAEAAGPADDAYRFLPGASAELTVVLERTPVGVRWSWPQPAGAAWDTALLGLRVNASGVAEPWVEVSAGEARVQQHLEAGAHGLRWLNLSGLRAGLPEDARVEIRGHGATLEPGPASLRTFANRLDFEKPVLILAPHPDDAEIAAFGLYSGNSNATIVTVTAGNAGDFNYRANLSDPAEHYLLKGYLRAVDSVTVPWLGGVPPERCFNLGYFDARLEAMRAHPEQPVSEMYGPNQDVSVYRRANVGRLLPSAPRTATWAHLVEDLTEVLRRVKPAVIVMPHPALDTHHDHQYVAVAAVEALERWDKTARFLLYTNHASDNLYPFGPPGTAMSLPPWAGPELAVQGVYSHPVSPEVQLRKLFALESMHDLRLSPAEQAACGPGALVRQRDDYPRTPAVDYFRRALRSEEVFFVFDRDGVREVIRSFLAQAQAAEPAP